MPSVAVALQTQIKAALTNHKDVFRVSAAGVVEDDEDEDESSPSFMSQVPPRGARLSLPSQASARFGRAAELLGVDHVQLKRVSKNLGGFYLDLHAGVLDSTDPPAPAVPPPWKQR
jgi:hypothetical protein